MAMMGSSSTLTKAGKVYNLEVVVDMNAALEKIPMMQSIGFLNPDLTPTFFKMNSHAFMMKMSTLAGATAIQSAYEDKGVGDLSVNAYYTNYDDFGHEARHKIYSLQFTRALNDKINWDGFDTSKLPKVAKSFRFDPQFVADTQGE